MASSSPLNFFYLGISDEDKRIHIWDYDNSLAIELQAQERSGNPEDEGITWSRYDSLEL